MVGYQVDEFTGYRVEFASNPNFSDSTTWNVPGGNDTTTIDIISLTMGQQDHIRIIAIGAGSYTVR
ncbi:MAG: hypothetical protein FWG73_05445 [Planctomycetaceae bacterium]|nr:hypothetical protein [Planctomycetaceae bacterium]